MRWQTEARASRSAGNLRVAENVTLILPLHRDSDAIANPVTPSPRSVPPARHRPGYEDKVGRRAIRLMDLADLGHAAGTRSSVCWRITTRCAGAWVWKEIDGAGILKS